MTLIKSKERIAQHGEVFTAKREVDAMLGLVEHETQRIESRFLEPACGNGNFLSEILARKLEVVTAKYKKKQIDWEFNALVAISSIYGVELMEDNTQECRQRLFKVFQDAYEASFKSTKQECLDSARFLLERNILRGNALDFTHPDTGEPIIFSEWSPSKYHFQRRDFKFQFLVEKSHQFSLFNDEGDEGSIDQPVKADFPLAHFLSLASND